MELLLQTDSNYSDTYVLASNWDLNLVLFSIFNIFYLVLNTFDLLLSITLTQQLTFHSHI